MAGTKPKNRFQQAKTAAKHTGNLPNTDKFGQGKAALKKLLNPNR